MSRLKIYNPSELTSFYTPRKGETKLGDKVKTINNSELLEQELKDSPAKFVLFGIKESIGVKANHGVCGTESAWELGLSALLNTQHNSFNRGKKLLVLGYLDFEDLQNQANTLDPKDKTDLSNLRKLVETVDQEVTTMVYKIVTAGKIPIIIGGGHNNAYGNIKGTALALNQSINAINFDAHTDFRALEGRHSGNGFSYAFQEGFLQQYFIFGLHENYTSKSVFKTMDALGNHINYNTFEAIKVRNESSYAYELEYAKKYIKTRPYGIEIDLDAIQGVASSAMTPSGFSANEARQFLHFMAASKKVVYLHLCEAAPSLSNGNEKQIGKILSYLITDFMRAR